MVDPLKNSSFPVSASKTYSVALPTGVSSRSFDVSSRARVYLLHVLAARQREHHPIRDHHRLGVRHILDIQVGTSVGLPSFTSTLNAITLPSGVSP